MYIVFILLIVYFNLDLVGKTWSLFRVSPLWNLNFDTNYLNLLSKQLKNFLINHLSTNMKNQINSFSQISVEIESKEAHHECIALKVMKYNLKFYSIDILWMLLTILNWFIIDILYYMLYTYMGQYYILNNNINLLN